MSWRANAANKRDGAGSDVDGGFARSIRASRSGELRAQLEYVVQDVVAAGNSINSNARGNCGSVDGISRCRPCPHFSRGTRRDDVACACNGVVKVEGSPVRGNCFA